MAWSEADGHRRRYHVGNLRADLLQHARAILEDSELSALNLRALASRAGIAPGSVYHHYENKAALLAGLAEEGFRELQEQLETAVAAAEVGTRFRAIAEAYLAFAVAQPGLYALMFDTDLLRHPDVLEARNGAFRVVEGLMLIIFAARGPLSSDELHNVALALWSCCHGGVALGLSASGANDDLVENIIQGLELLFRRP